MSDYDARPDYSINPVQQTCVSNVYFWRHIDTCPRGVKVLILTTGGTCVIGHWEPDGFSAWAPLPRRMLDT